MKSYLGLLMGLVVMGGLPACVAPVDPGDNASPEVTAEADDELKLAGRICGDTICGKGTTCCNASCGICVPKGGVCTQQVCEPEPEPCGANVCGAGTYCCNASCGICAPDGGFCTQQMCN